MKFTKNAIVTAFFIALSLATPSYAQTSDSRVNDSIAEMQNYYEQAKYAYSQAESAANSGDYASACTSYRLAARHFKNASVVAYNTSWKMPGYAGSKELMEYSKEVESYASDAQDKAKIACSRAN